MSCAICQDSVGDNMVTLACTHLYCQDCILSWTAGDSPQRASCPVCRAPVAARFETQDNTTQFRRMINSSYYKKMEKAIESIISQNDELGQLYKVLKKDVDKANHNHAAARDRLQAHNKEHRPILRKHRNLERMRWKRSAELYNARATMLDLFPVTNIFRIVDNPGRQEHVAASRRSLRLQEQPPEV